MDLTRSAVERVLADATMGIGTAGHVYDVAADGTVKRYKLPK